MHAHCPDRITATVTNISNEDQVIVRCVAQCIYPRHLILRKHLKRPFMRRRFYRVIRYAPFVFDLLGDASLAREELGWVPTTSFEELVEEMVERDLQRERASSV